MVRTPAGATFGRVPIREPRPSTSDGSTSLVRRSWHLLLWDTLEGPGLVESLEWRAWLPSVCWNVQALGWGRQP